MGRVKILTHPVRTEGELQTRALGVHLTQLITHLWGVHATLQRITLRRGVQLTLEPAQWCERNFVVKRKGVRGVKKCCLCLVELAKGGEGQQSVF